jgi:hypothetical protein
MKSLIAFDTSALVSLGHTELIDLILENFDIILTNSIINELKVISIREDNDAVSARKWLNVSKELKIDKIKTKKAGEDGLFEICTKKNIFLVIDDIKAIKKFKNKIKCFFSVHIIYTLYKKEIISKERAILSIEKMRAKRTWKENIIYVTARTLFE